MPGELGPGSSLGRYQILGMLGRGGMANVYKAIQPALERVVALKVIRTALTDDPDFDERFRREAKAIARLSHPNIVQVFDFDEIDGRSVLAMQFLDGGTLKEHVVALASSGQRMERPAIVRVIRGAADALDYAHRQGVVHRDIKPSNIMLADGRAIVTDFGIAKMLQQSGSQMTQTGVGLGTPEYMSPEQGMAEVVDARSDVYSLAVVAYELLLGKLPFAADTPMAVVIKHIRDPIPLPSAIDPALRGPIEQVLLKGLAKVRDDRYPTAGEFASALERAITDSDGSLAATVLPARPTRLARRPIPLAALGIGLAILLGGGAVGAVVATRPSATPTPVATAIAVSLPSATQVPPSARLTSGAATALPQPTIIPKGAVVFVAKFDGDDLSPTFSAGDRTATAITPVPGGLEYSVLRSGNGNFSNASFNMAPVKDYVAEFELQLVQGGPMLVLALRRGDDEGRPAIFLDIDARQRTVRARYTDPRPTPAINMFLMPAAEITGFDSRKVVLTVVNQAERIAIYVDQRQVAQFAESRLTTEFVPTLSVGQFAGSVRLTAARYYQLPP